MAPEAEDSNSWSFSPSSWPSQIAFLDSTLSQALGPTLDSRPLPVADPVLSSVSKRVLAAPTAVGVLIKSATAAVSRALRPSLSSSALRRGDPDLTARGAGVAGLRCESRRSGGEGGAAVAAFAKDPGRGTRRGDEDCTEWDVVGEGGGEA